MICIICRDKIAVEPNGWAYGHNAEPAMVGRCCRECNDLVVQPMRLRHLRHYGLREMGKADA